VVGEARRLQDVLDEVAEVVEWRRQYMRKWEGDI